MCLRKADAGRMKDNIRGKISLFLKKLKLPSFKLLLILCFAEAAIYWMGNPIIYDGLAWHQSLKWLQLSFSACGLSKLILGF
jgi:hypothetical protein